MIAYGVCIGNWETYRQVAAPALASVVEPGAPVAESSDNAAIATAYNEILDAFAAIDDLEALVLLHEDVEIRDPRFAQKVRAALADPDVAVVGVIGARDVPGLEWWGGRGVGRCEETRGVIAHPERTGEVDAVDGLLLVLSPWAVRNLRFDERYGGFHAYDVDFCFAARAAGKRVAVAELDVFHSTKGGFGDGVGYRLADAAFREKWQLESRRHDAFCPTCDVALVAGPAGATHEVALCPECELGATLPPPAREIASAEIWEQQYNGNRLAMRPQWLFEAQQRINWLQLHVPEGRLLELGSGTGEFCATAAAAGFEAYGIEPSTWAAEQARALGANVLTGDGDAFRAQHPGLRMDVIVAFHVFEHVHEPRAFLRTCRELLVPGGTLALEVPNFASAWARRDALGWVGPAVDDHVYHYTPASLAALLADEGFEVEGTLGFTTRVYESPAAWEAKRAAMAALGLSAPAQDMLRVVARAPRAGVPAQRSPESARGLLSA